LILVDTSVWIDFLNQRQSKETKFLASEISSGGRIVLCGVVITEILFGMRSARHACEVAEALAAFPMLPDLDREGYLKAAELYRTCRSNGYTIRSTVDCIIAQICIRDQAHLLARDRDFEAIAKNSDLSLLGSLTIEHGFLPLPKRGAIVTNEMINKLRDEEGV
jgi:predicted nucleic acid-binding protein